MIIEVEPNTMTRLMALSHASHGKEFSGLGFCEIKGETIWVYDFVALDVGSEVFTEIPVEKLMELMDRPDYKNMKVWVHLHPMGDGKPGKHNWSGTDEMTIQNTPLGGLPEMVKWSVSMVLTLGGWVGRIDNYVSKKTKHLEVTPSFADVYGTVKTIKDAKAAAQAAKWKEEQAKWEANKKGLSAPKHTTPQYPLNPNLPYMGQDFHLLAEEYVDMVPEETLADTELTREELIQVLVEGFVEYVESEGNYVNYNEYGSWDDGYYSDRYAATSNNWGYTLDEQANFPMFRRKGV